MATANNTIDTRIQLKHDTEANWLAHPIVPLLGEIIIYTPDNTHTYSRVKIGDGNTTTTNLPFIDSGTLNGTEVEIVKLSNYENFPATGSPDKLYVDLSTDTIYHYTGTNGYVKLSNFIYNTTRTTVNYISQWRAGRITNVSVSNNVLRIVNGLAPELLYEPKLVVQTITKEGAE